MGWRKLYDMSMVGWDPQFLWPNEILIQETLRESNFWQGALAFSEKKDFHFSNWKSFKEYCANFLPDAADVVASLLAMVVLVVTAVVVLRGHG